MCLHLMNLYIMLNVFLVCDALSVLDDKHTDVAVSNKTRNCLNTMDPLGCTQLIKCF